MGAHIAQIRTNVDDVELTAKEALQTANEAKSMVSEVNPSVPADLTTRVE